MGEEEIWGAKLRVGQDVGIWKPNPQQEHMDRILLS